MEVVAVGVCGTDVEIVEVIDENIRTRNRRLTNHCYFTMVEMEDGKPKEIPPYVPKTDNERLRDHSVKVR